MVRTFRRAKTLEIIAELNLPMIDFLYRSIYAYGSPSGEFFGHLTLDRSGTVRGYAHPNEHHFAIEGDELVFRSADERPTSRFHVPAEAGALLGHVEQSRYPLHLVPVIRIELPAIPQPRGTGVFINSIPKSGTYFAEAAFALAGFPSLRFHVDGITGDVIDWRDIPDAEVHRLPDRALRFPPGLLAPLLAGGSIAGHVAQRDLIASFQTADVLVIHLVRNLRDQMISNYRALAEKRIPVGTFEDHCLRQPFVDGLRMFYAYHHGRCSVQPALDLTRRIVDMITGLPHAVVLRYEDFSRGEIPDDMAARLDAYSPSLAADLRQAFVATKGQPTPTLSTARSDWGAVWTDDLEAFFHALGLDELNRRLGYAERWEATRSLAGDQHDPEQDQDEAGDVQAMKPLPEEQSA
jgi:hypothetical protein